MRRRSSRVALVLVAACCVAGLHSARAAHAAVGTPVANAEMPTLDGGTMRPLGDADANVLVFFRPGQERSAGALRELAQCQAGFTAKSVRWVGVVSDTVPVESVTALARDAGFGAPVLRDRGDALYGSLGIALHPVVVIVGRDAKLAAFEPFRSLDYCAVVGARIRHALHEISDDELRQILDPPKATEGGDGEVARRYRALAEAQFRGGNYDRALDSVRRSIDTDPRLAAAHALLGEILSAQRKCSDALAAYEKALTLDTANAVARAGVERCKVAR